MLEPMIIRRTATLEWNGISGKAITDDGEIYYLNINNLVPDALARLPENGDRVELYLHQNEQGVTEFVECQLMPIFDLQGGYINALMRQYFTIEGRKFFIDYSKAKREYLLHMIVQTLFLLIFTMLIGIPWEDLIVPLLIVSYSLMSSIYLWYHHFRQPESRRFWLFTLNEQGIVFQMRNGRECIGEKRIAWHEIQQIALKKTWLMRRPYWQIQYQNWKLGKNKLPLHGLSDSEFEQANLLLKQYVELQ